MHATSRIFTRLSCAALAATLVAGCAAGVADAREAERIAEVLELAPGDVVADVGAGDGEWSEALARRVGSRGRVYATEVDPDELERIRRRVEREGLERVEVVEGSQRDAGLPAECCDAILLRMVYHHFTEPAAMAASLLRALLPGGRMAVIDIVPQQGWRELEEVPERGGHGIPETVLVRELTAAGFEVVERHADWDGDDERYCVVFRPATPPGAARPAG